MARAIATAKEQQIKHVKAKKVPPKPVAHALPKPRTVKKVEEKPLFKMSKFKKIGPVVSTHRPQKAVAIAAV